MRMIFCLFRRSSRTSQTGEDSLLSLAEACHRFTPIVALRPGEAIFLDMTASLHLFRQEGFERRLQALSRRFGLALRITAADDAPTALALARADARSLAQLPIAALTDFISPFESLASDPQLSSRIRHLTESLESLGVLRIQDFLRLPSDQLARRFGAEGVQAAQLVSKRRTDPWPVLRLPEVISEQSDLFESDTLAPCSDLEPLLFAARSVLDRVVSRLRARALRLSALRIEFKTQPVAGLRSLAPREWSIHLPQPQGSTQGLMPILRDRLSFDLQRDPLLSPVSTIRVSVLETAPGHGAQSCFFNRKLDEAEAWDSLIGRLSQKLGPGAGGEQSVFQALPIDTHRPESAWKAAPPQLDKPETSAPPADQRPSMGALRRPSRLLNPPEPLTRAGNELIRSSRVNQRWSITHWEGPERISGEWWSDGFDRDYFRVHTSAGELLWVYSDRDRPLLYLHGYFD